MYYTIEKFLNKTGGKLSIEEYENLLQKFKFSLDKNIPKVDNIINSNFDSKELTLLLNQDGLEGIRPVEINNKMYMIGIEDVIKDGQDNAGSEYQPMLDREHLIVESL